MTLFEFANNTLIGALVTVGELVVVFLSFVYVIHGRWGMGAAGSPLAVFGIFPTVAVAGSLIGFYYLGKEWNLAWEFFIGASLLCLFFSGILVVREHKRRRCEAKKKR